MMPNEMNHQNQTPDNNTHVPSDKLEAGDITARSPVLRWLDNIWYHYKWGIIIGVFFISILIVGLVQIFTQEKFDTTVTVACAYRMDREQSEKFRDLLDRMCPEDYDHNGKTAVNLRWYEIYSEEEYNAANEEAEAYSAHFDINRQYNSEEYRNFNSYILTGDCSVLMVSPYLYTLLVEGNRLMSLTEIYKEASLPAGTMADGYGLHLAEMDVYIYNDAMHPLPETTILCLLRPTISGSASNENIYRRSVEIFRAMADYRVLE